MAGWSSFKLGRPGFEITFDVNPAAMTVNPAPVQVSQRNLSGGIIKTIVSPDVPQIQINSTYLTLTQRNQFSTLANIDDTLLGFWIRGGDLAVKGYRLIPIGGSNQIYLPPSSITRLDKAYSDAGLSPANITITGVFAAKDGSGSNLFGAGSYNAATREVVCASSLGSDADVYVFFTYSGWLVDMQISLRSQGGWLDRHQYDCQLVGA